MKSYLFLLAVLCISIEAQINNYRRVCYITNWSQYVPGKGKFTPSNVDPTLCTHIIYGFAKISNNHLAPFEWNDVANKWSRSMYGEAIQLKERNNALKVLLSVGGWGLGSVPFSEMVSTADKRKYFIKHAIPFLRKHGFDGLDLNWEFPAARGGTKSDKPNLTLLVQELRAAFDEEAFTSGKDRLLLTCSVAALKNVIDSAYEIVPLSRAVDFIMIMTYDLHGAWEKTAKHHSPLHARPEEKDKERQINIEWTANYWASKGAPKEKLLIGLALYGRGYRLKHISDTKPGAQIIGTSRSMNFTQEPGVAAFYEVCLQIRQGTKENWITGSEVPYIVVGNDWIGYDNKASLELKVNWVKANGFGGIFVWALALDDFNNMCGYGHYPLMNAIVKTLAGSTNKNPGKKQPDLLNDDAIKSKKQPDLLNDDPIKSKKQPDLLNDDPIKSKKQPDLLNDDPIKSKKQPDLLNDDPIKSKKQPDLLNDDPIKSNKQPDRLNDDPIKTSSQSTPLMKLAISSPERNDEMCQNKADGFHVFNDYCDKFLWCVHGTTFIQSCPVGTAFNSKSSSCLFKNDVKGCEEKKTREFESA